MGRMNQAIGGRLGAHAGERRGRAVCAAVALAVVAQWAGPALTDSAHWSTARHDLQRTARSPIIAAHTDSLLYAPLWAGSGEVPRAAVEGPDGSVYFSNGVQLRAVNPHTGTTLWIVWATGARKISAPSVGPDGAIHVSQTGNATLSSLVMALNSDGSQRWVNTTPELVAYFSDLAVDAEGRVFGRYLETQFTSWHAFALDATGALLWKTSVPYASEFDPTPPALLADGDMVITAIDADWNDRLMRLDADTGDIEWSIVPGGSLSGPVVADNGLILVHSPGSPPGNGVRAFDPETGALVWSVPYFYIEYGENNPPLLLPGGDIVAIANGDALGNRSIYRISPDGTLLGTAAYPSTGYYTDAIAGGDGTVYVWTSMRFLAFSPTTGAVIFDYEPAPTSSCLRTSQATILSDGSIFASWQRRQTCDSPYSFGEYVTISPPGVTTGVGAGVQAPQAGWLRDVTPNPAGESVAVRFELPQPSEVSLGVFDARGSLARLLHQGQVGAGPHSESWDGRDVNGRPCSPGVYFIVLATGLGRETTKVVLLDATD